MKKLLALLLAVLTIVSVFSVSSFAENEPVEELPKIELNLSVTLKEEYKGKVVRPYVIGMGESFQLKSNAPNTRYSVKGSKYANVTEDGLLTVENSKNWDFYHINYERDYFFELTAEADGYQTRTCLMYISYDEESNRTYIYFDNLKSQTIYVTNIGKNPKVHFVYRDRRYNPEIHGNGYEEDLSQFFSVKSSKTSVATVKLMRKYVPDNADNSYKYEYVKYLDIRCFKAGVTTITVADGIGYKASFKLYVQKNTTATQTIGVR